MRVPPSAAGGGGSRNSSSSRNRHNQQPFTILDDDGADEHDVCLHDLEDYDADHDCSRSRGRCCSRRNGCCQTHAAVYLYPPFPAVETDPACKGISSSSNLAEEAEFNAGEQPAAASLPDE